MRSKRRAKRKRKLNHEYTKHSRARSKTGDARDEISRYRHCALVGCGPGRDKHALRGDPPWACWLRDWIRAWRVRRAAPSAPMGRCTSPKALSAESRESIRTPGI